MCSTLTVVNEDQVDRACLPRTDHMTLAAQLMPVRESGTQLCWVERSVDAAITQYFADATRKGLLKRGWHWEYTSASPVPLDLLPLLPGRNAVVRDIEDLAEALLFSVDGSSPVRIRLDVASDVQCPRFHTDNVKARLLCTYQGPGTQWIDDRFVDRSKLGAGSQGLSDEDSGLLLNPDCVKSLPLFAVALLKGRRWPGNEARGAVHRSPLASPPQLPRVLVAIDLT